MQELKLTQLLKFFLDNPYKEFYLRELAKKLKISPFAIKKYADFLLKESIITEEKKANLRYFKANISNLFFKYLKISANIREILKSELIEFLKKEIPNCSSIILFGSLAKGEDDENSDIDLLVIGKEKHLRLTNIEEKTGREIKPHILSWNDWNKKAKEDTPFYFEVINQGIPLYGELPLIKWK